MTILRRYELAFDLVWKYVKDNLEGGNTLSLELLNSVDFSKGLFFTLLPDDANIDRLYEFETGGIIPQNPEQKILGKKSTYSIIPTIQDQLCNILLQKMQTR